MPLREQQDLLARLYTEKDLLGEFLNDPAGFDSGPGIGPDEAESLAAIAAAELKWFSESLVHKRLREVTKMLPLIAREIGSEEFDLRFKEFAGRYSPTSVKRHLEDALAFADELTLDLTLEPEVRNMIRFEARRLRHNAQARRFSWCFLQSDPRLTGRDGDGSVSSGFGLWIAIGGWSRVFSARTTSYPN